MSSFFKIGIFGRPKPPEPKPDSGQLTATRTVIPAEYPGTDFGIKVLAEPKTTSPSDRVIDIIAVHGLGGHREKTWLHPDTQKIWLRDFLPKTIPNARIMTYGYQTEIVGRNVLGIMENAEGLLGSMQASRFDDETRPLILIGHSLGGLVIKKALLEARDQDDPLFNAVKGIVFMAVPHRGADIAKYATYLATVGNLGVPASRINLEELQPDSRELSELSTQFSFISHKYSYITVMESEKTASFLPRGSILVVPQRSARLDYGKSETKFSISGADHRTVCKFASEDDGMYITLSKHIARMVATALGQPRVSLEGDHLRPPMAEVPGRRSPSPSLEPLSQSDQECLQALFNPDADPVAKKATIPKRAPGTCEWFLHHEKYLDWVTDPQPKMLWVSGHPGCGKTVLSSFLVDHLMESPQAKRGAVYYFFCNDKQESFRHALSILRATLHMLFTNRRDLLKYALQQFQTKGQAFSRELITMWNILLEASSDDNAGPVYCIVDAINECEPESRAMLLQVVTSYFGKTTIGGGHLKLFVTSRPEVSVIEELADVSRSRLKTEDEHENIDRDVRTAIKYGLEHYAVVSKCSAAFRQRLEEFLVGNAEKTFLWVSVVLRTLLNEAGESEDVLLELLTQLPQQIEDTYEAILSHVPPPQRLKTKRILSIVITSVRPLSVAEVNIALAVHQGDTGEAQIQPRLLTEPNRIIQRSCGALIRISQGKVYLVHQTAKDFLVSPDGTAPQPGKWRGSLREHDAHLLLARSCVWYLQLNEFVDNPLPYDHENAYALESKRRMADYTSRNHFLDYSARFWMNHFRESQSQAEQELVELGAMLCDTKSKRFWTWFQIHWILSDFTWGPCPRGLTPLAVAGIFGLETIASSLLARPYVDPDEPDTHKRTPLSWAAEMGHMNVVRLLVGHPKVNPDAEDDRRRTPLIWASLLGQAPVVQFLLEKTEVKADHADEENWTPLSWAAIFGCKDVASILVNQVGVDVNHGDVLHRTPLALAAVNGHEAMVKLLLEQQSVDANACDILGKSALLRAAQEGHDDVVEILLATPGVHPDQPDKQGRSPLAWAAKCGHERVVRRLLELPNVDPDRQDVFGIRPLAWAAHGGYYTVVELLNARDDVGANFTERQRQPPEIDPVELLEREHEAVVARLLVAREHCTADYLLTFAPSWGRFNNEEWYHTVETMLVSKVLQEA